MKPLKKILLLCWLLAGGMGEGHAQLWEPLGGGLSHGTHDLYADSAQQRLYAVGQFKYAGDSLVNGLAVWDGTGFSQWGGGIPDGVHLMPFPNFIRSAPYTVIEHQGEVFVGGNFDTLGGVYPSTGLSRWNGVEWLDCGYHESVVDFEIANGELFGFGVIQDGIGEPMKAFGRWNGSEFEHFGTPYTFSSAGFGPYCVEHYRGDYYFGGNFQEPNNLKEIMRWNGSQWLPLQEGIMGDAGVNVMRKYKEQLFVGGLFFQGDGNADDYLMAWDGTDWYDPFPLVHYGIQVFSMEVINGALIIVGTHYVWDENRWNGPYGIARYDGNEFCSFGGLNSFFTQVAGYGEEIFVASGLGTQYYDSLTNSIGDTVRYLARWIGGDSVDYCIAQPVRVTDPFSSMPVVTLQPNPARDYFRLTVPAALGPATLALYDLQGRTLLPARAYAGEEIDVWGLPAGMYLVEVRSRAGRQVLKLVRE